MRVLEEWSLRFNGFKGGIRFLGEMEKRGEGSGKKRCRGKMMWLEKGGFGLFLKGHPKTTKGVIGVASCSH